MTYNSSKKSKARCYLSEIYQGSKGIMHQERFSPHILHTRGLLNGLLTAVQHKDTKSQSMVSLNPCCITVSPVQLPSAKLADMQFPRLDLHMKQEYILEFIYKSTLFSHRHIKKINSQQPSPHSQSKFLHTSGHKDGNSNEESLSHLHAARSLFPLSSSEDLIPTINVLWFLG